MNTITRGELNELLAGPKAPILIDVTPEDYFQAGHLPGAKNCCVYEVSFLDAVANVAPDKEAAIVLYGSSDHSLASCTAQEKLTKAGYTHTRDYRGGLEDWRCAGLAVEGAGQPPRAEAPRQGRHEIDTAKSRVLWTGRNMSGEHTGTIGIQGGWIEVAGERASGEITLDMNSIANLDIADGALNRILIAHLKSDDFFDTAQHPTAAFALRYVTINRHARPGSVNADIAGSFTLKGVTGDLGFPAIIEALPGGGLSAEAHFDIDRTRWNVLYGSGKFYECLGKHLVHDLISLSLHIRTR